MRNLRIQKALSALLRNEMENILLRNEEILRFFLGILWRFYCSF